ncbi:hypothetical protein PAECIP111802_03112 [Paenibacillus allorhizosphaerae]|uniref:Uncharacterized protein n=1 Tax=Paenibacillus allorhizosphaerae TaxID=2849866 RepID=A0ABN7TKI8_9BACL|nr:hypothetical protein PAECIP111802_03112 [Paenibacillus allorhizosphaerae]
MVIGELFMDKAAPCKGCSADVIVSEKQIQRILASLDLKDFQCVSQELYQARVNRCMQCPSLQYGTTCQYCGCIVQIRAKMIDKHCPKPGKQEW